MPPLRLTDILCTPCQDAILAQAWTVNLTPVIKRQASFADVLRCRACRALATMAAFIQPRITALPDLTATQRDELAALHEAAHAAPALAIGQPVHRVKIHDSPVDYGTHLADGDTIYVEPLRVSLKEYIGLCCAGQQANLRYLAEHGLATRANRLDIRMLGWQDIQAALQAVRSVIGPRNAMATVLRYRQHAEDLLDAHWPAVLSLQAELRQRREIVFTPEMTTA